MNLNKTKFFDTDEVYISSRMNEYLKKNFGYEITGDLESLREAKASLEVTKAELKDEYMSAKYVENMLMIETIKSLLKAHGSDRKTSIIKEDDSNSDMNEYEEYSGEDGEKYECMDCGHIGSDWVEDDSIRSDADPESNMMLCPKCKSDHYYTESVDESQGYLDAGNIVGYLDTIDEYAEKLFKIKYDNIESDYPKMREYAYRIQNAVDDIRTRELEIEPSNLRQNYESVNEDAEGEEKGPDHYRYVNDSQLSRVQDRLRLTISELDHAIQYRAKNSHLFFNGGDKAGTGDLYGIKDKLEKIDDEWDDQTELYGM